MKTKIQIKTLLGDLLYEHEAENNSVKKTLEEAVKNDANLGCANLGCANLGGANLIGANLISAKLRGADLHGADLHGADLHGADLHGANLRCANLGCADLHGADLHGADLHGADLYGANLRCANLRCADLDDASLGEEWGKIESASDVLSVGAIGSRNAHTTIFHTDKGIFVQCGCFRGALDKFAAKVKETHAGTKHERDYNALIEFIKNKFSDYDTQTN